MDEKEGSGEKTKVYSNSRLWLYENCPEAFKVKYIDKIFPELPKSINAFLGSVVHDSLEWLYNSVKEGRKIELDDLIRHFAENWKENFTEEIRTDHLDENAEHKYLNKGIKFLIDYYKEHSPFSDNTLETEKRIIFPLDESKEYFIQGFVDRIVYDKETNEYEVHDYKTNEYLKNQEQVDSDRQLAFYHLGLQEIFGKQITVKLLWHFLAHNKTLSSRRTEKELEDLKKYTLELIKKIENTTDWPACRKRWCDWCAYKRINNLNLQEYEQIKKRKGNQEISKFI